MLTYTIRMVYQLARGYMKTPKITSKKTVETAFRCWPVDIDLYFHMNNSNYLRTSELARWRLFPGSGFFGAALKTRMMFLAVDQKITYLRPIQAFQQYIIETKCDIYSDDKWIWYTHTFKEHPDRVKPDTEPKIFAKIELRAVMKEQSGKTIKPSTLGAQEGVTALITDLYEKHETDKPI
jgi:acyl-CoA thioesterase FadM